MPKCLTLLALFFFKIFICYDFSLAKSRIPHGDALHLEQHSLPGAKCSIKHLENSE